MNEKVRSRRSSLTVRNAAAGDIDQIIDLLAKTYPDEPPYSRGMIQGQMTSYANGQLVVEAEGTIVGYAACFRASEALALRPHTWLEITGGGYGARHDPKGDWLYGMEVCVSRSHRRLRIGQRLYDARRRLCEAENLKGVVFGGRLPGWGRRAKAYPDPLDYIEAVRDKRVVDPVVNFHLREGFSPIGVLKAYHPDDKASRGCAAHMVWRNPLAEEIDAKSPLSYAQKDIVRVATVQFQARLVSNFEEFVSNVEYFVDVCADYRCDFVVFPELFTLQLLALGDKPLAPAAAIEALTAYTPRFVDALQKLSVSYNVNIIGGSHPTRTDDGEIQNVAYVFLRDGSVHAREKLHPTPDEKSWWGIQGGDEVSTIATDCGPIGVLICYDSEFPELARKLADEGARILFVPFCTDNRQGYLRVRYCCQARAVENQLYVALAGNVGNLPNVENMDVQYAKSAILTPCDFRFARDGVAAEASENVETLTIADLNLADLAFARAEGTVQNLRDRRFDLYRVSWTAR
ncbi:MAG: GNAT family N-acetyltransferase [Parvularculaceae bacterium]